MQFMSKHRTLLSWLIMLVAWAGAASAHEPVRFDTAHFKLGALTARRLAESGAPLSQVPKLDGYLFRPRAPGRHPAVVYLHGCAGLSAGFKAGASADPWVERLNDWNYIVLVVDSFSVRGIGQTCTNGYGFELYRVQDAYGALDYLAQQAFVDPERIALIGFSAGGVAALQAAQDNAPDMFELAGGARFKAVAAFYPFCVSTRELVVPTLVLIGEADDWSPAERCRKLAQDERQSGLVSLVVYPHARHGFDMDWHREPYREFEHTLQFDPTATDDAIARVRTFLARQFGRP